MIRAFTLHHSQKTFSVFHHQWFKQVKDEALPLLNAFWQYLLSEGCLGLTPGELSRHPSSYSQFVFGPEIVVAVHEIKLPQVKVNGSDTEFDFRKESLSLLQHPAVETEVYSCVSIFMGCPELHEYKYLLHRGRTQRKRRPRKLRGFRSKYASWQRVCSHGLPGGAVCVQTGSAGIADRPNLNRSESGDFCPASYQRFSYVISLSCFLQNPHSRQIPSCFDLLIFNRSCVCITLMSL